MRIRFIPSHKIRTGPDRKWDGEKETLIHSQYIIEVLIFIYLSFVRLLLYNKHLIDV